MRAEKDDDAGVGRRRFLLARAGERSPPLSVRVISIFARESRRKPGTGQSRKEEPERLAPAIADRQPARRTDGARTVMESALPPPASTAPTRYHSPPG